MRMVSFGVVRVEVIWMSTSGCGIEIMHAAEPKIDSDAFLYLIILSHETLSGRHNKNTTIAGKHVCYPVNPR